MNFRKMLNNIPAALEGIDIDNALDLRDSKEFDSEWIRVYNLVKEQKSEENPKCGKIREEAYKKVYDTLEDDEIAAYISDDFGLMFDADSLGISDPWLDKLIDSYQRSVFPCGKL